MDYKGRIDADKVLGSAWMVQRVEHHGNEVAARARALAPKRTWELAMSITVNVERNSGVKHDRPVAVVSTNAHAKDGSGYGSAEEFGSTYNRGNFFLRRAAGSL